MMDLSGLRGCMQQKISGVQHIIAVASGKGGVGTSTVAVNLALTLAAMGKSVGILDADIYGPSIPVMLGARGAPDVVEQNGQKKIQPLLLHGLQTMSVGYLIEDTAALAWRGPMATAALQQLLQDTLWDHVEYLIIDLPPGTGDILLSLTQKVPLTGVVIVTTPQTLALADARRAAEMFRKVKVPLLGVIENMSKHTCSACGHVDTIFGEAGGGRLAAEYAMPLLGELPIDSRLRAGMDVGLPSVVTDPQGNIASHYAVIAHAILAQLTDLARDADFPAILVKND